jgi:hypothetical protein
MRAICDSCPETAPWRHKTSLRDHPFCAGMARTDHDDRPEPRCICRRWRAVSVNSADLSATIDDGVILVI